MSRHREPALAASSAGAVQLRTTRIRVLRSEWTKLYSLRSTVWSLLTAALLLVATSVLLCLLKVDDGSTSAHGQSTFDPTAQSLSGVELAQVAVGVMGVLMFTGEYSTGLIRTTFAAVPRRLPVLWAKAGAFAAATFAACAAGSFAAFFVGQGILAGKHLDTTLAQPGVARAVLGGALYLTVVGLLSLGLGSLARNTAAAVSALLGLLLAVPIMVNFLPQPLNEQIGEYLPGSAGGAITDVTPESYVLAPWTGLGVACLYTVVILALAAWRLRRWDT